MIVRCDGKDGCNQEFDLKRLEVAKLDNGIEKTYFICSHCGKEYVAFYTDEHIRKKQAIIRGLKSPSAIKQLRKEIAKDMKELREKVESNLKGAMQGGYI